MKKIVLIGINSKYVHTNIAIRYIKKYLEKNGVESNIYENTVNNSLNDIIRDIFLLKPDICAFSVYIWNREYVFKIVNELKKMMPLLKIYLGGPEVAYDSEDILKNNNNVDLIFNGEGEDSFLSLLKFGIDNGHSYTYVSNNLIHKKNIKMLDLSELDIFPYDDNELLENGKIFYYESSRGCPYSCSYCMSSIDKQVREYNISIVKKHLLKFINYKVPLVKFIDRTFNLKKERYMEIWKFLLENYNEKTSFHFEISADLLDDECIEFLKKIPNGYFQFEVGVQSSNIETLNEINRKCSLEKLKNNILKINRNIHLHLDLIAGLPLETYEIFKTSFNFVYSLKGEMIQLGFLKFLKGTKMFEKASEGYNFFAFPPYEVISTPYISYNNIIKLKIIENCLDLFYNSGKFNNSVKYIVENYYNSPFEFYEELAVFWEKNGFHNLAHKPISLFNYFYNFVVDKKNVKMDVFIEMLKFDFLLLGKPGFFPEWFNRNSSRELFKNAVENSNYFNSEKDGYKNGEFEIFMHIFEKKSSVLFIYNKQKKVITEVVNIE